MIQSEQLFTLEKSQYNIYTCTHNTQTHTYCHTHTHIYMCIHIQESNSSPRYQMKFLPANKLENCNNGLHKRSMVLYIGIDFKKRKERTIQKHRKEESKSCF